MSILSRLSLLLALAGAAAAPALAQTVTYPPGSAIGLVLPKGMTPSANFSGFEDRTSGATILTADLPVEAYEQILTTFTPAGLAPSGFQASGPAADWAVKNGTGRVIRGKQAAHGLTFRKWVLLAKGAASTAMVSVQAPETTAKALPDAAIEDALKTLAFRPPPSLDEQVSSLSFKVGDLAGFRVVRVMSGSALMLTEGAQDVVSGASQPIVVIASAAGMAAAPKDMAAFARSAVASVAGASDVVIEKESLVERDGAQWSRVDAKAAYRVTGESIFIEQFIRFTKDGYLRVVGVSRSLDQERFDDRFRRVAESVRPK